MQISRYRFENYGSLIGIEIIPVWQVISFLPLSKSKIAAAGFVLKAGYKWVKIYCSQDTMGHRQTVARDNNGEAWAHEVVGFIPGDEDEIEQGLQLLHHQRYLVRVTRPNGIIKIIGTLKQPVELKMDSNSQNTVPGLAGTSLQFSGATNNRALTLVL